jgi:alpha-ketoglutarate-dependent taurine dioxygenase
MDPEIAYIRLRDENPAYIEALMHPKAMTIPEFIEVDGRKRPKSQGPVFWVDEDNQSLEMRYSERSRNIFWRTDRLLEQAIAFLRQLLHEGCDEFLFHHRLEPGQGLICNNVLHTRSAFTDFDEKGKRRLLYRSRYCNRIANTGLLENA